MNTFPNLDFFWLLPNVLGGMSLPYIDPVRRMHPSPASAYPDTLQALEPLGIRAVVSLLDGDRDAPVYAGAGWDFLGLPMPDGGCPTLDQARQFVTFVDDCRDRDRPVVAHCVGGLGRTGTLLAIYRVHLGLDPEVAIQEVRSVRYGAIETFRQEEFIRNWSND